jgi:hypothetical protein
VSVIINVPLSSQCNDWALAHVSKYAQAQYSRTLSGPTSGKRMPAYLIPQGGNRAEASVETALREKETTAILYGCGRLAKAERVS